MKKTLIRFSLYYVIAIIFLVFKSTYSGNTTIEELFNDPDFYETLIFGVVIVFFSMWIRGC